VSGGDGRPGRSLPAIEATTSPPPAPPAAPPADRPAPAAGIDIEFARPTRIRSASDVIRLLIGLALVLVGLVLATVADHTVGGAQADVVEAVSELPSRVEQAVVGVAQLIAASVIVAIACVLVARRTWRRLGVLVIGAVVASLAMKSLEQLLDLPETTRAIAQHRVTDGWIDDPGFPSSTYLAASSAVVTLAGVWLSRRWKRALWAAIVVLALLRVVSSAAGALDVVLSIAVGVVVGSLALVVFGAPNRAPDINPFVAALGTIIPDIRAVRSRSDHADAHTYSVDGANGRNYFVKLRTPDDRSADYLARTYRAIRLRSEDASPPFATVKRRIEHEALALHGASDAGVATPELVGVAATEDGSAMLVTAAVRGRMLAELEPHEIDRALLDRLWHEVGLLAASHIAHRDVVLENIIVTDEGAVVLVDFDDAEVAATPRQCARDVAQLLVETSLLAGAETAVSAAIDGMGVPRVAAALPLLQPLALAPAMRRRLRRGDVSLDELQAEVQRQTGVERVQLERLERVRPRTIVSIVALTAAFYFLLPQLANIGDTVDAFRDAGWEWIPLILLGSALTYFFAAVSFVGSVAERVPFGAALRSRIASSFVSSITPAGTGGLALGARVLQRMGIDPGAATASVGVNTVAGVIVHLTLLFAFVSWTGQSGVGGFSLPDSTVLLAGVAVVLGVTGVALLFRRIRQVVLEPVLRSARAAAGEIAGVFSRPTRVAQLFGGASGMTLSYVLALAASVEAFDGGLTVPQIGAAYLGASLVGNASPTPGGLGAMEAALVAALTGFGMASGPAVSAVLTFRLATYWLPILPGWIVFRWMQRREEI
jgi:undecaprenyl-diphosphatase